MLRRVASCFRRPQSGEHDIEMRVHPPGPTSAFDASPVPRRSTVGSQGVPGSTTSTPPRGPRPDLGSYPPATEASPRASTPVPVVETTQRGRLLADFHASKSREVDIQKYVDSQILRIYGVAVKPKNHASRFEPAMLKARRQRRLAALHDDFEAAKAGGAETLIPWLNAHVDEFDRTLVTDIASEWFDRSQKLPDGWEGTAAHWVEGDHSAVGGTSRLAAAVLSYSVLDKVADPVIRRAARFALQQSVLFLVFPWLSGRARSATDVVEKTLLRKGGEPTPVSNVAKSPTMRRVLAQSRDARATLTTAIQALPVDDRVDANLVGHVVAAARALAEKGDTNYKERGAMYRSTAVGKAVGGAVGLVQSGATIATALQAPVIGIAMQAGATAGFVFPGGFVDESLKQSAIKRNNAKHSSRTVMPEAARTKRFVDFVVADVDEPELRRLHMTYAEARIAGVREVYTDRWAQLVRDTDPAGIRPRKMKAGAEEKLAAFEAEIDAFETALDTFDEGAQWDALPSTSIIRKCIDRDLSLVARQAWVRVWSPAERAQPLQRQLALMGGGISAGLEIIVADALPIPEWAHEHAADPAGSTLTHDAANADASTDPAGVHWHADADESTPLLRNVDLPATHADVGETPLRGPIRDAVAALTGTALVTTAALVAEVRKSKQVFKARLSRPPIPDETFEADGAHWVKTFGNYKMDARTTRPYLLYRSSFVKRRLQLLAQLPEGIMTGPKGLYYQAKVAGLPFRDGERDHVRRGLREALDTLKSLGAKPVEGWDDPLPKDSAGRPLLQDNVTTIMFELSSLDLVREAMQAEANADVNVGMSIGAQSGPVTNWLNIDFPFEAASRDPDEIAETAALGSRSAG